MAANQDGITLFLCGDVMLGRGIDQILPHPGDPRLYESYVTSALGYVVLAEEAHGPIPRPCGFDYVWGDALAALEAAQPQARIVNLETSVTVSAEPELKGINYKMHPGNVGCLLAAKVDCCVLANNHVLDWGPEGLTETLTTLKEAGLRTAGAGRDETQASAPASIALPSGGRVLVFGLGARSSGIPAAWAASAGRPGVRLLRNLSSGTAARVADDVLAHRRPGDIVVVSIHWGSNWGYEIEKSQRAFAHHLIEAGACDVLHGHSSHHVRAMEVHEGRLILYGCGDFITDYEGIDGFEQYRGDIAVMYLPELAADGALKALTLVPFQSRRFRLERAAREDSAWLLRTLEREGAAFGTRFSLGAGGRITLGWG